MVLFLFESAYFLRPENNANFIKNVFFLKNEVACACINICKYYHFLSVYCMAQHVHIVTQTYRSYKTLNVQIEKFNGS